MQYMFILTAAPDAWADNDATADDGIIDDWALYTRALHDAGVLVAGQGLSGTDTATTVRVRSGSRTLVDGPFVESKEHLIGYYVVDTADLDTALDWAAKAPNARIGSVEVRPLVPGTSPHEMLAATAEA